MSIKLKSGSLEPFALLYRNGETATSGEVLTPKYTDICLDKHSQASCDEIIEEATRFNHPIQSEKECQDYIALHNLTEETLSNLQTLTHRDRAPFTKVLTQISAGVEPAKIKLGMIASSLKAKITKWREQLVDGQRREAERLRIAAEEKRNEAKYSSDPKKARQAKVQAEVLEKEAAAIAPKPQKGAVDTEEYWEGEIVNRVNAAKLPEKIVLIEVDQTELNKHIKALQRSGQKITPNILPGLTINRKTRVKFHK